MESSLSGRGVFTTEPIPAGSLIEICPVIVIPEKEVDVIHHTDLHDYYFVWGENNEQAAIALGYGSLYNHSYDPNAEFILDLNGRAIEVHALRDIRPGEEITFNYHGDPECRDDLWFAEDGSRICRIKPIL
jgi:SET domain-containing protein